MRLPWGLHFNMKPGFTGLQGLQIFMLVPEWRPKLLSFPLGRDMGHKPNSIIKLSYGTCFHIGKQDWRKSKCSLHLYCSTGLDTFPTFFRLSALVIVFYLPCEWKFGLHRMYTESLGIRETNSFCVQSHLANKKYCILFRSWKTASLVWWLRQSFSTFSQIRIWHF